MDKNQRGEKLREILDERLVLLGGSLHALQLAEMLKDAGHHAAAGVTYQYGINLCREEKILEEEQAKDR